MIIKRRILLVMVLVVILGAWVWLKFGRAPSQPGLAGASIQKPGGHVGPVVPTVPATIPASGSPLGNLSTWSLKEWNHKRLDELIATGDPLKWKPSLGELLNQHYKREEAIAIFARLLENPDWDVRVTASWLLLELGSYAGVPVLQAALHAASAGELPVDFAEQAAETLHRFRQIIDPHDLFQAYQRFQTSDLLTVATMQQVPEMYDLVRRKRANRELGYDTEWIAAYLGMKDAESVEQYKNLLNAYPEAQLLGHWALYQALRQPADLDYVISTARQFAGMEPREEKNNYSGGTRPLAFDFLAITVEPRVTKALEEIVDFIAQSPNGNSVDFRRAFGALFYIHKDDAFVNQRALEYLRKQYRGPGVDGDLLMDIAASRRTPEIDSVAMVFGPMALSYEYSLNRVEGRPPEKWGANLIHVPVSVVPPLSAKKP